MAQQVAARMKGDNYQGRFFWYQAARLLFENSPVESIVIEHDDASGVDDVVVYYRGPGVNDSGSCCTVEFFQVKYHVDHRNAYSSNAMIDPKLIKAKSSLLQRFYAAYQSLQQQHPNLLLCLVSNWTWRADDPLATAIRDCNGALPETFFTSDDSCNLGKIRCQWRNAVKATDEEFERFARRLRLQFNYFSRGNLIEALSDRLWRAGLQPIDWTKDTVPYDDLALKCIMNGKTKFDAASLRDICRREGLLADSRPSRNQQALGVRSFMRFAEHLEDECDSFICLAKHFDGRQILDHDLWEQAIFPEMESFLGNGQDRQNERHLHLECHLSVAYGAGYILHRSSGVIAFPIQKGRTVATWKPSNPSSEKYLEKQWSVDRIDDPDTGKDLVVSVSITHDIRKDVESSLRAMSISPSVFLDFRPASGVGASSVQGPDHAIALAEQLQQLIVTERKKIGRVITAHLFAAAPNGLMFFLGQLGRAIDPVRLYEFDFQGGSGYAPSLSFPNSGENPKRGVD